MTTPRIRILQRFIFSLLKTYFARGQFISFTQRCEEIDFHSVDLLRSTGSRVRVVFSVTLGTGSIRVGGSCAGLGSSLSAFLRFAGRSDDFAGLLMLDNCRTRRETTLRSITMLIMPIHATAAELKSFLTSAFKLEKMIPNPMMTINAIAQ